jgi:hypothetical protein
MNWQRTQEADLTFLCDLFRVGGWLVEILIYVKQILLYIHVFAQSSRLHFLLEVDKSCQCLMNMSFYCLCNINIGRYVMILACGQNNFHAIPHFALGTYVSPKSPPLISVPWHFQANYFRKLANCIFST